MCAENVGKAREEPPALRVLFFGAFVVEFHDTDILNEGDTQTFIYGALKDLPNAPRVPKSIIASLGIVCNALP